MAKIYTSVFCDVESRFTLGKYFYQNLTHLQSNGIVNTSTKLVFHIIELNA